MDRASQVLAQGVPPGVPSSYYALADHGNKAQGQQYLTPWEEDVVVKFLLQMSNLGQSIRIKLLLFIDPLWYHCPPPAKTNYQYHSITDFPVLIWSNDCRSYNSADMAKEMHRILSDDGVVLHDPGGIGKTSLLRRGAGGPRRKKSHVNIAYATRSTHYELQNPSYLLKRVII
ncbi:hypothetical protein BGZ60DRAFT_387901 [Tricladium varicosporioides]|nr:hypothetical protein BGZ60DRAFT_387901 [Hymenoscyphus varicosporioides]